MAQLLEGLRAFTPAVSFAVLFAGVAIAFFLYYWVAVSPRRGTLEWIAMREARPRQLTFPKRHPMTRRDILPMLLITAIYAFAAFFNLGNTENITSNLVMTEGQSVSFSLGETADIGEIRFFSVIGTGTYTLEYSEDGTSWRQVRLEQLYNDLLRWNTAMQPKADSGDPDVPITLTGKLFRVTAHPHENIYHENREFLELGELALFDTEGRQLPIAYVDGAGSALFDEQELVEEYFWTNSSYFDEIYHPRTAKEHLDNVYPYEESHPPLGKLTISIGIWLFGMTPFGWRFMGTLFGVLMLPLLYVLLKNMFGRTAVAACGTVLFAAEFMHLTQTRIGTIDTYGVFYILAMFYFMYRWLTLPPDAKLRQTIPSLFLCGLMFGIGFASKWIVAYGGAGLAILWVIGLVVKYRNRTGTGSFFPFFLGTSALCVVFFIAIPAAIYLLSYIPYVTPDGELTLTALLETMWDNQVFMFTYHSGVDDFHSYSSRWYQWIFDVRPILYFREMDDIPGMKAAFAAFNNPLISWAGLLCVILTGIETFRRKCGRALFIFIGYLAQLIPWILISRTTFAYHYFPSILFCVIAISYAMDAMLARRKRGRWLAVGGFTAAAVGLFIAYYPVLIGLYVPRWYTTNFLRWFPSWPL